MSYIKAEFASIAEFFALVILLIALVIGIAMAGERAQCSTLQRKNPGLEYSWEVLGGCFVKTPDGIWIDEEHYYYAEPQK